MLWFKVSSCSDLEWNPDDKENEFVKLAVFDCTGIIPTNQQQSQTQHRPPSTSSQNPQTSLPHQSTESQPVVDPQYALFEEMPPGSIR